MNLSRTQERGLIILVAVGLVASGLALLLQLIPSRTTPIEPIKLTGVRVLIPTFLDTPEKVDLNTATVDELVTLPGIGEVLAARILAYREEHGPFQTLDQLKGVNGIGEKVVEAIAELITLGE